MEESPRDNMLNADADEPILEIRLLALIEDIEHWELTYRIGGSSNHFRAFISGVIKWQGFGYVERRFPFVPARCEVSKEVRSRYDWSRQRVSIQINYHEDFRDELKEKFGQSYSGTGFHDTSEPGYVRIELAMRDDEVANLLMFTKLIPPVSKLYRDDYKWLPQNDSERQFPSELPGYREIFVRLTYVEKPSRPGLLQHEDAQFVVEDIEIRR